MCDFSCFQAKAKFSLILAWIQIIVYTTTSGLVISSIFILMMTNEGISLATTMALYSAVFAAVPVHLIREILMAVSLVPNNKELLETPQEQRYSSLAFGLSVLLFLVPGAITGFYLLLGVLQEKFAVRMWTIFAVLWFALSIMEVVAGGYVNGIVSMVVYAIAIWIVHKELRKGQQCHNRAV